MNETPELNGQPGELSFTLSITRAATGETEHVQMVGHIVPPKPETEEVTHGCNP